ncbi:MAG: nucleotide exchange factor GrpE [Candidatus Coproplasma sp.]
MTDKENFTDQEAVEENAAEQAVNPENTESAKNAEPAENAETAESQTAQTDGVDLSAELEKATAAAEDYKRKWYSVSAEYDNYRKRTKEAVATAFADGKAEAILKLLPVADTFGYAYDGASDEKTKAGIDKIVKNFNAILLSMGVEEIPVNVGDGFDETVMEAIMNLPCEEGESAGVVKNVLKKGYRREGKVIRFAQVSVTV